MMIGLEQLKGSRYRTSCFYTIKHWEEACRIEYWYSKVCAKVLVSTSGCELPKRDFAHTSVVFWSCSNPMVNAAALSMKA